MQTLASKFMESQNHSIYRAYHTAVEIDGIHKITSPNGIINFVFQDGSIVQTDMSLNWIGELIRLKD
jgi:hypothetical protein